MRLLIITSEPLNPSNTQQSGFELSQAMVLSKGYEVAILAVQVHMPAIVAAKKLVKKIAFSRSEQSKVNDLVTVLRSAAKKIIGKKNTVHQYDLDGVPVYETQVYPLTVPASFDEEVTQWNAGGMDGFKLYTSQKGMPDIVHAHGRFLMAGALALEIKKHYATPFVYTDHSSYYRRQLAPKEALPVLKKIMKEAAAFTVVSESLMHYINKFLGANYNDVDVVPNLLDPLFEDKLSRKEKTGQFVFAHIASLDPNKAQDILLQSFARSFGGQKNYSLIIAGDGYLRTELESLTEQLGITEQVSFVGRRTKIEIRDLLDRSQAFVLSSHTETFGVVLIEALSRGCPVITTASGGPEKIVNKDNGMVVPAANVQALADAMVQMSIHYKTYDPVRLQRSAIDLYGHQFFFNRMKAIYQKALQCSA